MQRSRCGSLDMPSPTGRSNPSWKPFTGSSPTAGRAPERQPVVHSASNASPARPRVFPCEPSSGDGHRRSVATVNPASAMASIAALVFTFAPQGSAPRSHRGRAHTIARADTVGRARVIAGSGGSSDCRERELQRAWHLNRARRRTGARAAARAALPRRVRGLGRGQRREGHVGFAGQRCRVDQLHVCARATRRYNSGSVPRSSDCDDRLTRIG